MSIVEKAMLRSKAERAKAPPGAVGPAPDAESRLPELPKLATANEPPIAIRASLMLEAHPHLARDFRFLKRPVLARVFGSSRSAPRAGNLVMITSDLPQAGKSFVSLHLAASMASEQMTRVLLIDADPIRHTMSSRFGIDGRPGLMELLASEAERVSDAILATDVESLYFMPAGQLREDATELLASPRMSQVLRLLEDPNLVVLLDSPPLLLSTESRVLADYVQHALVVVEAGRSTTTEVANVLQLLQGSAAAVNLVLNKTPVPGAGRHKDYYYPY